jgi:eukaryotic-like serine/threonine-protein kinase
VDTDRWEQIQELFERILALPDDQREGAIESACADDPALRDELRALIRADSEGSVLDFGLGEVARDVLERAEPGIRTIGPYRVIRELGRGGMGVVYLAERDDLRSRVAIKVLRDATLSPLRRARFAREQRTLAQLGHPSIARIFDAGVLDDGTPYFVMEHVDGVSITEFCARHALPVRDRLGLFREACAAVLHAHRRAVIHRDLKPSNILVTESDAGPAAVRLLDFGIAKQLEELGAPADQTQTGLIPMTPAYAAPEQLRGEPVGVHTDVYALGRILYELLTAKPAYDLGRASPLEAESLIRAREPPRPSASARSGARTGASVPGARDLPRSAWAELDVVCGAAMHPDPERRYGSVEALLRDLDHLDRGEPLEARPDSIRYRTRRFVGRNRQPIAAAAAMSLVLLGIIGFYTARLADQRDRARIEAEKAAQISNYLIDLFEAGDPFNPEAGELNVQSLLERGERRAAELASQPELKAQMLDVLGRLYTRLSEYDRAEKLLRRALMLRRDADPLEYADTRSHLSSVFVHAGQYDSAEVALREALAIRERRLPPNHPDLATNLDELGVVLGYRGDHEAAGELYRMALRIRRTIHRQPHEDLGISLSNLAVNLYQQGEYEAAERYYREALAVENVALGPDHPSVATTMANLGMLYDEVGNSVAADSLLSGALRIRRARLGDQHFETAMSLSQIGGMLLRRGEHDSAEPYLREALAARERLHGSEHPGVATALNGLAQVHGHRREFDAAEALMRRAIEIYAASLGERHRFTGVALCNLANLQMERGDHLGSDESFRAGLDILAEVHSPGHPELAHNRSRYGELLVERQRYEDAEPLLVDAHRTLRDQLGEDNERTRAAAGRVARLYTAWDRPERAEPFLPAAAPDAD